MKKIIVCDSGLGGLNIASRFFSGQDKNSEPCEIIYFNAYLSPRGGFNKLPSERSQEEVFRDVLEGMKKFSPDLCLIACNTLSIVYSRLSQRYTPVFPVEGIMSCAVDGMFDALQRSPGSSLLILGTDSTVKSRVYADALVARGIRQERIAGLACPGLATLLESDPASPEVAGKIAGYAAEAQKIFDTPPEKLLLGLCCTHFGFAAPLWQQEFSRCFGGAVEIVDPNLFAATGYRAEKFSYHARIALFPGAREKMGAYFRAVSPQISDALMDAQPENGLFNFTEGLF